LGKQNKTKPNQTKPNQKQILHSVEALREKNSRPLLQAMEA
jgi:hypothetical protein